MKRGELESFFSATIDVSLGFVETLAWGSDSSWENQWVCKCWIVQCSLFTANDS